jgi:DNA-binding NtrC family response regulator
MSQRVLVVSSDQILVSGAVDTLRDAGLDAVGAATFEEASKTISSCPPDLLIADERLGAFNGLHLVLRGHAASPDMRAIVTSRQKDAALESDARSLSAVCVVTPPQADGWLDPVYRVLNTPIRMSA